MVRLSKSEIYIMYVIWEKGDTTFFDIVEKVRKDKKISENTIRPLLARMVRKKAIYKCDKKGRTHVYRALINKEEYIKYETNLFTENVYEGDVKGLLLNLMKDKKLKKDVLEDVYNKYF